MSKRITWTKYVGGKERSEVYATAEQDATGRFQILPYGPERCMLIDFNLPRGSQTVGIYGAKFLAKTAASHIIRKEEEKRR